MADKDYRKEVLDIISKTEIYCPECSNIKSNDEYECLTCDNSYGSRINVLEWIVQNYKYWSNRV